MEPYFKNSAVDALSTPATNFSDIAQTPSIIDQKRQVLGQAADQKRKVLGITSPKIITDITDGDTVRTQGDSNSHRFAGGVDTYETWHGAEHASKPNVQQRVAEQRKRLAAQLGVDEASVTDQMVYQQGEKDKVRLAVEATTGKAYNEPIDLYGDYAGANSPKFDNLEAPVSAFVSGSTGDNRNVTSFTTPNGVNLNQEALNRGSVDPYATRHGLVGLGLTPEAQAQDDFEARVAAFQSGDSDGRMGDNLDRLQASGAAAYAGGVKLVAKWSRDLGITDDNPDEVKLGLLGGVTTGELLKENGAAAWAGVDPKRTKERNDEFDKEWKENGAIAAMWSAAKHMDSTLADSAAEMLMILTPGGVGAKAVTHAGKIAQGLVKEAGLGTAVAIRVSNDVDAYKENNGGEEPTTPTKLLMIATNIAALGYEKLIIASGIKLGTPAEKGLKEYFSREIAKKLFGVTRSGTEEGLQEIFDTAQQEYFTQHKGDKSFGEILTSEQTLKAGVTGAGVGAGLRGGKEVATSPLDLGRVVQDKQLQKDIDNAATNISPEDKGFMDSTSKDDLTELTKHAKDMESTITSLSKAETPEELAKISKEGNAGSTFLDQHINRLVKKAEQKALTSPETRTKYNDVVTKNLVTTIAEAPPKDVDSFLSGIPELANKITSSSMPEQVATVIGNLSTAEMAGVNAVMAKYRQSISDTVAPESGRGAIIQNNFEAIKANTLGTLEKGISEAKQARNVQARKVEAQSKAEVPTQKDVEIPTEKLSDQIPQGLISSLFNGASKKEVYTKLRGYSDAALNAAIKEKSTNPIVRRLANKVVKDRKAALKTNALNGKVEMGKLDVNKWMSHPDIGLTKQMLKMVLMQKALKTTEDVAKAKDFVAKMKKAGQLTDAQEKLMSARIAKIGKDAVEPDKTAEAEAPKKADPAEQPTKETSKADVEEKTVSKAEKAEAPVVEESTSQGPATMETMTEEQRSELVETEKGTIGNENETKPLSRTETKALAEQLGVKLTCHA